MTRIALLLALLCGATASAQGRPPAWLEIRFFDAGYGDSILLSTPEGHHLLIDAGRATAGDDLVQRRLVPYFNARGIRKLDAFLVSHPHWDHYGDPIELRRRVPFDAMYVNRDSARWLPELVPEGEPPLPMKELVRGDVLRFGALTVEVLNPPAGGKPPEEIRGRRDEHNWRSVLREENNRSLVVRATYGRIRFLFTGDLSYEGEAKLLSERRLRSKLRAEVLKLGHHGIRSSGAAWLRAVRPRHAVATVGEYDGKMRRPWPEVMWRLREIGARVLRTDLHGDVVLRTDGRRVRVQTCPELARTPRPVRHAARSAPRPGCM
jgi:competence protein ComEC